MRNALFIIVVIFCMSGNADPLAARQSATLTHEEIADMISDAQRLSTSNFRTGFMVVSYNNQLYPMASDPDMSSAVMWNKFQYLVSDQLLRIERVAYNIPRSNDIANPTPIYSQTNIWKDGGWYHYTDGSRRELTIFGQPVPTDQQSRGFIFNLIQNRFPSYRTLDNLYLSGNSREIDSAQEGLISIRFKQDEGDSARHHIMLSEKPPFRLLSHSLELISPEDGTTYEFVYRVDEWKNIGGISIPWNAHYDVISSATEKSEWETGTRIVLRTTYKRNEFEFIDHLSSEDRELFRIDLTSGTRVYDDRTKLSFEIGQNYLYLDGVMYETPEPIREHPGENLGDIIRSSNPVVRDEGASPNLPITPNARPEANRNGRNKSPGSDFIRSSLIVPVAVGGFTLLLGLWWIRRTRSGG